MPGRSESAIHSFNLPVDQKADDQRGLLETTNLIESGQCLYEMNINVRIKDSLGGNTPPFSGFASRIQKFDPGIFLPAPTVLFDTGIKFQVYA